MVTNSAVIIDNFSHICFVFSLSEWPLNKVKKVIDKLDLLIKFGHNICTGYVQENHVCFFFQNEANFIDG